MHEYLECKDETSNKYWEITVRGTDVTVHYGRIGTEGQEKTRTYDSVDSALKAAETLVQSKLKKGYRKADSTEGTTEHHNSLQSNFNEGDEPGKSEPVNKDWPDVYYTMANWDRINIPHLPKFVKLLYEKQGIPKEEWVLPIKPIAYIGKHSTDKFFECKQIPEWYLQHYEYLENMGAFHWFDLELTDAAGTLTPLRLIMNEGDADSNDGFFGAYYHRETCEMLAKIESTGDCETTVTAVSRGFIDSFQPHKLRIPEVNEEFNRMVFCEKFGNNLQVEEMFALGIQVAYGCYIVNSPKWGFGDHTNITAGNMNPAIGVIRNNLYNCSKKDQLHKMEILSRNIPLPSVTGLIFFLSGMFALFNGAYPEAEEIFTKGVEHNPSKELYWRALAYTQEKNGKDPSSANAKAVEARKAFLDSLHNEHTKEYDGALPYLFRKKAAKEAPPFSLLDYSYAIELYPDEADGEETMYELEPLCEQIIEKDPGNEKFYRKLAAVPGKPG